MHDRQLFSRPAPPVSWILHYVGLLLVFSAGAWLLMMPDHPSHYYPLLLGFSGVLVWIYSWVMTYRQIKTRNFRYCPSADSAPHTICRVHRIPAGQEDRHTASTDCPCCPVELHPSLFIHGTEDLLPVEWTTVKEYYTPDTP